MNNPFSTLKTLPQGQLYYSLPALEEKGVGKIQRLPVSIRVVLESLLRNCDGKKITEDDIERLARWSPKGPYDGDVPFVVGRVLLQDFTGVPLLVDLATMRDAMAGQKREASCIEPQVPVDLIIDHSVQVDRAGTEDAYLFNLKIEFERNKERYEFLKWGQEAFKTFKVVPPGIGICHQVNLEYLASGVLAKEVEGKRLLYFDTLVGTDSHTTMINGLGVVGWGVGGIEAEAAMLGQPYVFQMPEVIGVHLSGKLREGVTATDLTLCITQLLRQEKVVGKFVEFFGEGAASLSVADRATIGNMAPEYGATMGYFPIDDKTLDYLKMTGRDAKAIAELQDYLKAQKLFGIPRKGEVDYTKVLELDLSRISACVAGPKRPQDRIDLKEVKSKFEELIQIEVPKGGYGKEGAKWPQIFVHSSGYFPMGGEHESGGKQLIGSAVTKAAWSEAEMVENRPFTQPLVNPGYTKASPSDAILTHGSVVIAAITSCTNTSNPSVMLGAGIVAKKAVMRGLKVHPMVKTSLAPGSRVVTDYLEKAELQTYLNQLGFQLVAYGCTTCIGNSGPLDDWVEKAIKEHDLVVASVLSGNRNFEARIHGSVKANFLMSPPLVVAFALAGKVNINFEKEAIGKDREGAPVYLRDLWPSSQEIEQAMAKSLEPAMFKKRYAHIREDNPIWEKIGVKKSAQYAWDPKSTYIQKPPYFEGFTKNLPKRKTVRSLRALALFGDSVTTDHISPAGAFKKETPAGKYLLSEGVREEDFNSYGSRRGNHQVMMRGAFANVRIRNQLAQGKEGGWTQLLPEETLMPIFDACQVYATRGTPLIIFAGKDYGMGSSRDWAAKGTALLGVRAVVARSFERIHRTNLIGMGVLPLEFPEETSWESLGITGKEIFSLVGLDKKLTIRQKVSLEIDGGVRTSLTLRLDTPAEIDYYENGGILPYVLRELMVT
jgi:aconitate hydratase